MMRFPAVRAANLEGRKFDLPADFEGELNIVFVAFKQWQQVWVDRWLAFAKPLAARFPEMRVYELPVLPPFGAIQRWWIDNGMRMGIPDRKVRDATITIYTDKQAFRAALGMASEDTIYALIVKRDGAVLWHMSGEFTDAKGRALAQVIARQAMI